jgi:hypothetical protein
METFAKYTPTDHIDYIPTQNAANNLKKATTQINERYSFLSLFSSFLFPPGKIRANHLCAERETQRIER